jgi:hypothetical protein
MRKILIGILEFPGLCIPAKELSKLRGYFGSMYKHTDLLHNHRQDGAVIYRYPRIQFKIIENEPFIYAIGEEGIEVFQKLFLHTNEIHIGKKNFIIKEKRFRIKETIISTVEEEIVYSFYSPWIGLNSERFREYKQAPDEEKERIIAGALINNIISFCKTVPYQIKEHLTISHKLTGKPVVFKNTTYIGFTGYFKVKMRLPEYIGLGKSTSHGFGMVKEIL